MRSVRPAHIALCACAMALLAACNPTKRVPQGDYLLVKNRINSNAPDLTKDELSAIIKQKPNNKVLGQRLYLHLYNLSDPEKTAIRQAELDSACALKNEQKADKRTAKNEARAAKGKKPRLPKPKTCRKALRTWAREDVGEPPTILDSALTQRSADQLKLYMTKEGYFNAAVYDTVYFQRRKWFSEKLGRHFSQPKAEVQYTITSGRPYRLCTAHWAVDDPAIDSLLRAAAPKSLLVPGMRFDADVLDLERGRITDLLHEKGYLYFTRELLQYVADTTAGDHEVDLVLRIERPAARGRRGLKGTPEGTVWKIGDVTMDIRQRTPFGAIPLKTDTTDYKDFSFLFDGKKPKYRPKALAPNLLLKPGARYAQTANDRTYRRLTGLRIFDRVDIAYDTTDTRRPGEADVLITTIPSKLQNLSLEGFGTNRGGFLGVSGGLNYKHKNLFRSTGSIQAQFNIGLEAQQSLGGTNAGDDATLAVQRNAIFNTVELGPEVTIRFPRFIIPFWNTDERWPRTWGRVSAINVLYNYQRRPDYTRTLAKVSYGYEWNRGGNITWGLYPMDVNFIRIPLISADFRNFITTANDALLRDSYTDHVIAGGRLTLTLNTQDAANPKPTVFFWRPTLQTSGNLLRLSNEALGLQQQTDTAGNSFYTLGGVRFAQFVKLDNELRWHHTLHAKSSLAFRVAAGMGVPYGNLEVLPFESSFFSGGANGLRAWRARSLGPGSYRAPLDAFDRVGEIRIEGNAEYRFKLVGYLEGAFFVDIGNIWDRKENPAKPGSGFELAKVPGELAIGTGIGARLNFDFFLVRFDLGLQTKDPALPMGQRWLFQPKDEGLGTTLGDKLNFNLGIGYPF